jgi:opacity protein-like surface antigen
MKKLVLVAAFLLGFSAMVLAQDTPAVEVFGGYSLTIVDTRVVLEQSEYNGSDLNLNGWNGSVAFNANKWAGLVAEFGGSYGTVGDPHMRRWMDVSIFSIMVGPKVTLRRGAAAPFVQALFGNAHVKGREAFSGVFETHAENDLAMALGGGIDVNLNQRVALRPVQLDYFTTRTGSTGDFAQHLRFSTGFVIKLGKR